MAPSRQVCAILAMGLAAASGTSSADFLERVKHGQVPKSDLEIVLAQHKEDVSWSNEYSSVRTLYCKGGDSCSSDAVKLPNEGREGHTFLHHIVNNYDKLAKWTVFSQAGKPSEGYFGQDIGGGHLLTGSKFEDYLIQSQSGSDSHFMFSSKLHFPSLRHSFRSSFRTMKDQITPRVAGMSHTCPSKGADSWGPFSEVQPLRRFISEKCGLEEAGLEDSLRAFWDDYVQLPRPKHGIVHYVQGARFAASRERIQQRSHGFYEQLLQAVSGEEDPCLNYLLEWTWNYIIGAPSGAPCALEGADEAVASASTVHLRSLASVSKGVSGVSGVGGKDTTTTTESPVVTTTTKDIVVVVKNTTTTESPVVTTTTLETVETTTTLESSMGNTTGKAVEIKGSMTLAVADADAFVNDPSASTKVAEGIAEALKCSASWVEVELSVVGAASRRLGAGRRMSTDSQVKVDYTVTVPSDNTDVAMSGESLMSEMSFDVGSAMSALLAEKISAKTGVTVEVVKVGAPTMEAKPDATTTTEAIQELPGSGASRQFATFSVAIALLAMLLAQ